MYAYIYIYTHTQTHTMEYYSTIRKEEILPFIYKDMGGPWEYLAEENKSVRKS